MKKLKRFSVFVLAICMLFSVTSAFASAEDNIVTFDIQGTNVYGAIYDVLELVNEYRADEGLSALTLDAELTEAAMLRAAECAVFFNHTRPNGTQCFTAFPSKFTYGLRAENIAIGQNSAASVMDSWMTSSGHYANIMNGTFKSIGIGCYYNNGVLCWVQLFSSESGTAPSSRLYNKNVTTTIEAQRGLLYLGCTKDETNTPNHFELTVLNQNLEFPYLYVKLLGNTIYFTSSNNNILKVTNNTHLEYVGEGTATLRGYIDGILFFQTNLTVGNPSPHVHNYTETVTAPTCTTGGYTTYTCTDCGDSYTANGTAPIPHDYKVTAIPNGYLYECKNCDHSYQETVATKLPGDADGDGKVSNADLIAVARYIVGLNTALDISAADIDKSGNITNADLIAIARRLVGLE